MRIFITGATGFIGRELLNNAQLNSDDILALCRDHKPVDEGRIQWLKGGLEHLEEITDVIMAFNPDICIHMAWTGIPDFSLPMSLQNLNQSMRLFELLSTRTNCRKFIISGSCFEYGATQGVCAETREPMINSFFSWAKLALYDGTLHMARAKSIDVIWLRFFYVYGPRQREASLIPMIIRSLRNKQCPSINNPFNANDFIEVSDVARAVMCAVKTSAPTGIYNVGFGQAYQVLDVCRIAENIICGNDHFTQELSRKQATASINFWSDNSTSLKGLGWQPRITLEAGIRRYIESVEAA